MDTVGFWRIKKVLKCENRSNKPFPLEHLVLVMSSYFGNPSGQKSWLMFNACPSSWAQTRAVKPTDRLQRTVDVRNLQICQTLLIFLSFLKMLVYQQYRIRTSLHDLGLEYFSSRRWEQDKPRVNPKNFYLSSWTGWLTENADLIVHLFLLKRSMPGPSKLLLDGEPITEALTNKNIATTQTFHYVYHTLCM